MSLLATWKKVLLFGAFGAVGALAGWLVGEPLLAASGYAAKSAGAGAGATLVTKPTAPSGSPPPLPDDFRRRVEQAGGSTGDVQITLIWDDANDLDLHCVDPTGYEIWYKQKASPTRGRLDVDRNAGCQSIDPQPVENIFWPKDGAPQGDYTIYVNFFQRCTGGPDRSDYRVNILANGERKEIKNSLTKLPGGGPGPKQVVHRFKVEPRLELYTPNDFDLAPGQVVKVPVTVRRAYHAGPVDVRLENLPDGVTAGRLTIPEGKDDGELELVASDAAREGARAIQFVATGGSLTSTRSVKLTVPKASGELSVWGIASTGLWTALVATGLCLALLVGQNRYLGKKPFAPGRVPLALVVAGAGTAGFVSGGVGQVLYTLLLGIGIAKLGFVVGWVLLGGLLGRGVSLFIPNLDGNKATGAGLSGGLLGAVAFLMASGAGDWAGRFGGAALLGFCIGLMVAVVEAAFRSAWLEVRFSEREAITVNLGAEPVKVGGDARACTVWARGAADVALRYWIRDGKVFCEDVPARREAPVSAGDTRLAGAVTVVVRTGAGAVTTPAPAPAPVPVPPPIAPSPAPPPPAPPAADDYDDGLPMPLVPPAPARRPVASILDLDDPRPAPPKPVAPPAPAAKAVGPAAGPKPPVPPPPRPPVPTAAKPPAIVAKDGGADACPTCRRKIPGAPGARYCMVCDKTF
ncbi:hypothetical protein R5W23_000511 [Gemmata sp. JC673]|uniref:Uncharacterized protein n=1 Tax=Gemmata algarum TaxID=2975278 RepID=A0ABU5EW42_9BACT|nr:hypothetical protein [Gemmata algarum]MDY3559518.1 hypothetical protein [Gemmata algarum]